MDDTTIWLFLKILIPTHAGFVGMTGIFQPQETPLHGTAWQWYGPSTIVDPYNSEMFGVSFQRSSDIPLSLILYMGFSINIIDVVHINSYDGWFPHDKLSLLGTTIFGPPHPRNGLVRPGFLIVELYRHLTVMMNSWTFLLMICHVVNIWWFLKMGYPPNGWFIAING